MSQMTLEDERFAVWAIRIMRTRKNNDIRLRNFIRLNFRRNINITTARSLWSAYGRLPIRLLNSDFYKRKDRLRYRAAQQAELARRGMQE